MSAEGTRRRRQRPGTAPVDGGIGQRGGGDPRVQVQSFAWPEPRTALCFLCLATCGALAGLVFQQSASCADVVERFHVLQMRDSELRTVQERLHDASEKLGTSEEHLQEVMASATLVPRLEEQVSRVRNTMHHIQDAQEKTSRDLQSLREKLQSEKDACRLYQHEVDLSLVTLKSEVKSIHSQLTFKINSAEQGVKSLTERVRELEDGTRRNIQTVKRQEEDELFHVEKQLQHSSQAAETLETEQNTLFAKTTDLNQKLSDCEPKVSEFRDHFPAVEGAVVAVLRVSNELMSRKKKTEEMALQMFNMENKMVKVVSDILDMQRALERL